MYRLGGLIIAASTLLVSSACANDLTDMVGDWRTVRHGAEVMIIDCGDGSPCGFLVSVGSEVRGGNTRDARNRKPELRNRPLAGLPILWGYSRANDGWRGGRLYNPETGQTFRSSLDLISSGQLRVQGCLGPFCRTQTWTRKKESRHENIEDKADE